MRIFSHLSFVVFLLALALQFLVVRDANSGLTQNYEAMQQAAIGERVKYGSDEEVKDRGPKKAFLEDFRNDMRRKVETAVGHKADASQLALGAMILAAVLWAVAIVRKEDRPYYGTNGVLLAVFCLVRWLNIF
ncbi:MAG: hypothetical protein IJV65_01065 [Kiritimatiellae bacterium]|nr:hypothetical protein [Kiritimatiellia bacterium]